jgi:hypothetical protein
MTFQRAEAPPVADAGPPPAAESASSEAVDAAEVSMFSVRLQAGAETDGAGESDAAEELAAAEEGAVQWSGRLARGALITRRKVCQQALRALAHLRRSARFRVAFSAAMNLSLPP